MKNQTGLYDKYRLKKFKGLDSRGRKIFVNVDPDAEYFVLKINSDKHAQAAALQYCISIVRQNYQLASELAELVRGYVDLSNTELRDLLVKFGKRECELGYK